VIEDHMERKRLALLLNAALGQREWAANEFDLAQKQVLGSRSSFFERLALFHSGTIAATITFSGILHQVPRAFIYWKIALFVSWVTLFGAMAAALARNWQSQNAYFYRAAAGNEKFQGKQEEAYSHAVLSGGQIISQQTGLQMDPEQIKSDSRETALLHKVREQEYENSAERSEKLRKWFEVATLIATFVGIALALVFAMRNFA